MAHRLALVILLAWANVASAAIIWEIGGGAGEDKIVLTDTKCTARAALGLLRPDTHQHYKQAMYYMADKSPGINGCWREFSGVGGALIGMVWDDGDNFAIPKAQFKKPAGA